MEKNEMPKTIKENENNDLLFRASMDGSDIIKKKSNKDVPDEVIEEGVDSEAPLEYFTE